MIALFETKWTFSILQLLKCQSSYINYLHTPLKMYNQLVKMKKKLVKKKPPEWDKIHTKKYNLVKPYCALFVPKSTFSFTFFSVFRDCRSKEKCWKKNMIYYIIFLWLSNYGIMLKVEYNVEFVVVWFLIPL